MTASWRAATGAEVLMTASWCAATGAEVRP